MTSGNERRTATVGSGKVGDTSGTECWLPARTGSRVINVWR